MCKDHGKVNGIDAVKEFAAARFNENVCNKRMGYLRARAMNFFNYMVEKIGKDEAVEMCQSIVVKVEKENAGHLFRSDLPEEEIIINTMDGKDNRIEQVKAECDQMEMEEEMAIAAMNRGLHKAYGIEGNVQFWTSKVASAENRLTVLRKELDIQNKVQDFIDEISASVPTKGLIPEHVYRELVNAARRLDMYKRNNLISMETIVLFKNQIHKLLKWKEIKAPEGFEQWKVVPDRIEFLENKLQEFKAKLEEAHLATVEELEIVEVSTELVSKEDLAYAVEDVMKHGQMNGKELAEVLAFTNSIK